MFRYTQEVGKTNGIDIDMNTGTGWPFGGPEVSLSQAAAKAIFECYEVKGGESVKLEIDIRDTKEEKQRDVAYPLSDGLWGRRKSGESDHKVKDGYLQWDAPTGDWKLVALFVGRTFQKVKRAAPGEKGMLWIILVRWP